MGSIDEVARQAGVSITTVSHVFSGRRPVAAATRERVLEAARRLSYRPHRAARGLATGRSMAIGLHFPFLGESGDSFVLNPVFPEVLEGLSRAAAPAGYGFLLTSSFPPRHQDWKARVDGVIFADPEDTDPLIPKLVRAGIPVVTTGRYPGRISIPWVDVDHGDAMTRLLGHLREQGYERPAFLSVRGRFSYPEDVEATFAEVVRRWDVPVRIVRAQDLSDEQAYRCAMRLLNYRDAPDAIVALADRQAFGVLRAAKELGVLVPGELGVAGEGDTVLARHSQPTLTTIRVFPRLLGEKAVEMLLQIIDGSGDAANLMLPTELVVRRSTSRRKIDRPKRRNPTTSGARSTTRNSTPPNAA